MIAYKPQDVVIVASSFAPVSATFECVPVLWGKESVEIKWYLNGNELVDELEPRIYTESFARKLIIKNVINLLGRGTHSAVIRCEAKTINGLFQDYADARLDVFGRFFSNFKSEKLMFLIAELPKISRENLAVVVGKRPGESLELACNDNRGYPRSKINWYFNNRKLSSTSSIFRLSNLEESDFGNYQCEFRNVAGLDIAQIFVKNIKNSLPSASSSNFAIVDGPKDLVVKLGSEITIPCRTSMPDSTNISWFINDERISVEDLHFDLSTNDSLQIKTARKTDSARFTCRARHSKESNKVLEASAQIRVLGDKLIEYGPSNVSMLIGSNVQMPCKLFDDYANRKDVSISWFRDVSFVR